MKRIYRSLAAAILLTLFPMSLFSQCLVHPPQGCDDIRWMDSAAEENSIVCFGVNGTVFVLDTAMQPTLDRRLFVNEQVLSVQRLAPARFCMLSKAMDMEQEGRLRILDIAPSGVRVLHQRSLDCEHAAMTVRNGVVVCHTVLDGAGYLQTFDSELEALRPLEEVSFSAENIVALDDDRTLLFQRKNTDSVDVRMFEDGSIEHLGTVLSRSYPGSENSAYVRAGVVVTGGPEVFVHGDSLLYKLDGSGLTSIGQPNVQGALLTCVPFSNTSLIAMYGTKDRRREFWKRESDGMWSLFGSDSIYQTIYTARSFPEGLWMCGTQSQVWRYPPEQPRSILSSSRILHDITPGDECFYAVELESDKPEPTARICRISWDEDSLRCTPLSEYAPMYVRDLRYSDNRIIVVDRFEETNWVRELNPQSGEWNTLAGCASLRTKVQNIGCDDGKLFVLCDSALYRYADTGFVLIDALEKTWVDESEKAIALYHVASDRHVIGKMYSIYVSDEQGQNWERKFPSGSRAWITARCASGNMVFTASFASPFPRIVQYSISEDRFTDIPFDRGGIISSIAFDESEGCLYCLSTAGTVFRIDVQGGGVKVIDFIRGNSLKPNKLNAGSGVLLGSNHGGRGAALYLYPLDSVLDIELHGERPNPVPEISLYPNPVYHSGSMVSIAGSTDSVETIMVYNLDGRLRACVEGAAAFPAPEFTGVYFVRAVFPSGRSATKILMVR